MIDPGLEPLASQRCPDCGAGGFLRGPAGGMNVNIECAGCGSRFNVAHVEGELIHAERINYNGPWPERGRWNLGPPTEGTER